MRVNWSKNATIAEQLTMVVQSALPSIQMTGLNKDLGVVRVDPASKGKAVQFVWRKTPLIVTSALMVREVGFAFGTTDVAQEAQARLQGLVAQNV